MDKFLRGYFMQHKLEEFRVCFDSSPIAFCVLRSVKDETGRTADLEYIYANKALADIDNSTVEKLVGNTIAKIFPNPDAEWFLLFDKAADGHPGEPITRFIAQLNRYLSIQIYHVKEDFCACIVNDVTAHEAQMHEYETQLMLYRTREKAERLRYDNQRLSAIISHADVYYWECDLSNDTAVFDTRFLDKFHFTSDKMTNYPNPILQKGIIAEESKEEFIGLYDAVKRGMKTAQKAIRLSKEYGHGWYLIKLTGGVDKTGHPTHAFVTAQSMGSYQELEQQFLVTLDQHGLYSWLIDLKYHTSTASEAFMRDFGHPGYFPPLDQLHGLAASRGIYPDDQELFENIYRRLYRGENEIRERYRRKNRRTGQWDWIYACYDAVRDASGELSRVIVSAANINHKVEEEARYETFDNYRKLVFENTEASFRLNLTRNLCDDAYTKNTELSRFTKETTADSFFNRVYGYFADTSELERYKETFSRDSLLKRFAEGKTMAESEHRLKLANGRTIWLNVHAETAQNPQNGEIETILYCFNIDRKKITESIVNELVKQDYEFILLLDLNTEKVTQFGGAPEASAGILYEDSDYRTIMTAALRNLIPENQLMEAIHAHEIITIKSHLESEGSYQVSMVSKTGRYLYWRFGYLGSDHTKVLIGRSDITESMRKEQAQRHELEEALKKARIASKAKTEFLANMSHDIRTPMNAIMGMTGLAIEHIDDKASALQDMKIVQSSGRHLLSLINDVLDLSYIESGKMLISRENFSLPSLIQEVTSVMQPNFISKEQDYSVSFDVTGHEFFIGDPIRIKQVLINLLSNANKYTPKGGTVRLFIAEHAEEGRKQPVIEFCVSDNGIGISKEKLSSIFDPFFREVSSTVNRVEGTGLGLSIVKTIVDAMDGHIRLESKKGRGSAFFIQILMDAAPENYVLNKYAVLRERSIIILENQPGISTIQKSLALAGIHAVSVQEEKDLLDKAVNNVYDAIVVSQQALSAGLFKALRENANGKPVLIAIENGKADIEKAEEILKQVDAMLPAPVFTSTLCDTIVDQLENRNIAGVSQKYLDGKKLLVVDDNNINRLVAKMMLEGSGAEIVLAEDGTQAVQIFADSRPGEYQAILMDVMMPIMGGYEATRKIRSLNRPDAELIPVIAMTANAFSEDIRRSKDAGMNAHITKPMDPSLVRDVLIRLL